MPRSLSTPDRLQSIADVLRLPVEVFFDELVTADPSLEDLRKALFAAFEAYTQGLHRKAQSVSLAGQN